MTMETMEGRRMKLQARSKVVPEITCSRCSSQKWWHWLRSIRQPDNRYTCRPIIITTFSRLSLQQFMDPEEMSSINFSWWNFWISTIAIELLSYMFCFWSSAGKVCLPWQQLLLFSCCYFFRTIATTGVFFFRRWGICPGCYIRRGWLWSSTLWCTISKKG